MNTTVIKIWGKRVGAVLWDEDKQLASFEYDPVFATTGIELSPLKMPLSSDRVYTFPELRNKDSSLDTFKGLPGLLADTLPDRYGNRLINTWLAQQGRPENDMNPVETLCFIGQRGMGALEFEPATHKRDNAFNITINNLVDIASQMLHNREQFTTNVTQDASEAMKKILLLGTSAGGARAKALVTYNEKTGEVKSGQTTAPSGFKHYLLKLDGVDDAQFGTSQGYGRVEMAYYLMAIDCGIDMMHSQLLEENGRAHFMTQRFDRENDGIKHHLQTLCAINHYDYNHVGEYGYEQLFQTMRQLRLPYPDAAQMFKRMVFNILARNCDDHTKNFSFILKQNSEWRLSPAYDVCFAYDPKSIWVNRHALSLNGKREHFNRADLITIAQSMNIKKPTQVIDEIKDTVSKWKEYANKAGVNEPLTIHIAKYINEVRI